MPSTTSARHLMLAAAITIASTSGVALADPEPQPTQAGKAKQAAQTDSQPAQNGAPDNTAQPETPEATEGAAEAAGSLPRPNAGAFRIARWMRSMGGRISMGPRLDSRTRVSMPNVTDIRQGWRVSVPTFASARMSAPPRRASQAAPPQQTDNEGAAEQTLATGSESETPPN